jgi:hypothetical protein
VMLFEVQGGKVSHADQYVGDPVAVTAFWA